MGWLLFVDGKLTGWHAAKPNDLAAEYKAERHTVKLMDGTQRDAAVIWEADRIRSRAQAVQTRRVKQARQAK